MAEYRVSLHDVLEAKEKRKVYQEELIRKYKKPLISFTLNIPGEIKKSPLYKRIHDEGIEAIKTAVSDSGTIIYETVFDLNTGNEAFFVIDQYSGIILKEKMVLIEENHKLGRILDIDVISERGIPISRRDICKPERQCMICGSPAIICMWEKKHTIDELLDYIFKLTTH